MKERFAAQVTSVHNVVMLAGLLGVGLTGSIAVFPTTSDTLAQRQHAGAVQQPEVEVAQADQVRPERAQRKLALGLGAAPFNLSVDDYYGKLRAQMRWKPVRYAGKMLKTPDERSRLLLTQAAARKAGLHEVGLNYRDLYGIIEAETSWVPRRGSSKDGTPNLGIAQFEPATAKAVGLKNPNDPVEAVHAAALHIKDAAKWSAKRIASLDLTPEQHARKLREGVSIFYNLSWKGRHRWNGLNTAKLPVETRRHIANARLGAREAAQFEAQLRELRERMNGSRMMTASFEKAGD